jgi:hypothetical protein
MDSLRTPLGPPSSDLAAKLGLPETWMVPRPGQLDAEVTAWKLGQGEIIVGDAAATHRGTTVEIWLTLRGNLMTVRRSWTKSADGSRSDEQTSAVHETPEEALAWLVADGRNKLGAASKAAWVGACRSYSPMKGMDTQRIE